MDDVRELKLKIERARECGRATMRGRAMVARIMASAPGILAPKLVRLEVVFPEPDVMHVFNCMFGRRMGEPNIYRLSFGPQLKWVGVSHPWGLKPGDIVVRDDELNTERWGSFSLKGELCPMSFS